MNAPLQPTLYVPHGGGPCFFMDDPRGTWRTLGEFLASIPKLLPHTPSAIVIVSGHWLTRGFEFTGAAHPPLVYDYYGFPPHTYQLQYPAPGLPQLAQQACELLQASGLSATIDPARGLDHGVFVPLKVAFPNASIPVVEMSLDQSLDPRLHMAAGKALAPLRSEGVLIVGAGMSFHNMRAYGNPQFTRPSEQFDTWLSQAALLEGAARSTQLAEWEKAPAARVSHPQAEHLLPMLVAAGAADGAGRKIFGDRVLETAISGFMFE